MKEVKSLVVLRNPVLNVVEKESFGSVMLPGTTTKFRTALTKLLCQSSNSQKKKKNLFIHLIVCVSTLNIVDVLSDIRSNRGPPEGRN